MEVVCICKSCSRTINKDYLYCPWCGTCCMDTEDKIAMETVFEKMEQMVEINRSEKITKLRNHLEMLESELSTICMSIDNTSDNSSAGDSK